MADGDLVALSRELKILIDTAQRIRDRINRHLSVDRPRAGDGAAARNRPPAGTRKPGRPSGRH